MCAGLLYFYWLSYCVHCCLYYSGTTACSHNGKDDIENIFRRLTDLRVYVMMWVLNFRVLKDTVGMYLH